MHRLPLAAGAAARQTHKNHPSRIHDFARIPASTFGGFPPPLDSHAKIALGSQRHVSQGRQICAGRFRHGPRGFAHRVHARAPTLDRAPGSSRDRTGRCRREPRVTYGHEAGCAYCRDDLQEISPAPASPQSPPEFTVASTRANGRKLSRNEQTSTRGRIPRA